MRCKSLEGREIRGQLSTDTLERIVSKRLLGKKAPKEENYEKRKKGPATKVVGTTWALVPRGAKEGNQWYPETLG